MSPMQTPTNPLHDAVVLALGLDPELTASVTIELRIGLAPRIIITRALTLSDVDAIASVEPVRMGKTIGGRQ